MARTDPTNAFQVGIEELRAHGYRDESLALGEWGLSLMESQPEEVKTTLNFRFELAETLYLLERWDEAKVIMNDVAAAAPSSLDVAGYLGVLAARTGDREEAERIAGEIAAREQPFRPHPLSFWRARIMSVLGEKEEAVSLLRQAHAEGRIYSLSFHRMIDLEPLNGFQPFEEFMRPKG
jgi:hypothetical protein